MSQQQEESEAELISAINEILEPSMEEHSKKIERTVTGFRLPIKITEVDDYDAKVTDELNRYVKAIQGRPALMRITDRVQNITNRILLALKAERRGDTEKAQNYIMSILKEYQNNNFFVSDFDSNYAFRGIALFPALRNENYDYAIQLNHPLSLFRCRSERIQTHKEMLHVPLSKRSLCSSGRFSLPGIPCLYLASTTYCCWKELGRPVNMSAAAFRLNEKGKKLKILNLAITQEVIVGFDYDPYLSMPDLAYSMRLLFPLVIATSICEEEKKSHSYNPEYTISHLIMRCLKELNIDGVAYLSTKTTDFCPFPQDVNVAIPIFSGDTQRDLGEVCSCFDMTAPHFFENLTIDKSIEQCNIKRKADVRSYVNVAFSTGATTTTDCSGIRKCYSETFFGRIDDCLAAHKHYQC